jgi:hypothetical protein
MNEGINGITIVWRGKGAKNETAFTQEAGRGGKVATIEGFE